MALLRARLAVAAFVVGAAGAGAPRPAAADPWYAGARGHKRATHLSIAVAGGLVSVATELVWKSDLAPATCRWCTPDRFDVDVRNALVWRNTSTAALLSNLDGFAAAPAFAIGVTLAGSLAASAASSTTDDATARAIDDLLPVAETVALAEVGAQVVKFAVGRERPFVYFDTDPTRAHQTDDDVSFFSAHSALTFALATSAGMVAHRRHAASEPYVWSIGVAIAASTGYLRIAADKHYATDVLTGAAVGVGTGLTLPRLTLEDRGMVLVPTGNGAAVSGTF